MRLGRSDTQERPINDINQIADNVCVVHAGCGVNALPGLQSRINEITLLHLVKAGEHHRLDQTTMPGAETGRSFYRCAFRKYSTHPV